MLKQALTYINRPTASVAPGAHGTQRTRWTSAMRRLTTTVSMSASMLSLRLNQPLLMASATQPRLQNSSTSLQATTAHMHTLTPASWLLSSKLVVLSMIE